MTALFVGFRGPVVFHVTTEAEEGRKGGGGVEICDRRACRLPASLLGVHDGQTLMEWGMLFGYFSSVGVKVLSLLLLWIVSVNLGSDGDG